jgi:cytochrome c55X
VRRGVSIWAAASLAAVTATAWAVGGLPAAAQTTAADGDQPMIDRGKLAYAHNCSHCHGPNMVNAGTVTPDLRTFPDDKTRFVGTVKDGKNNKMPPWRDSLSDDDIDDLWAYVSSRRKK